MADTEHVDNALADAGQSAAAPKPPESAGDPPPPMWPPWGRPGYGELKSCVALSTCYFFMFSAWNSAQTLASTLPIPPPAAVQQSKSASRRPSARRQRRDSLHRPGAELDYLF